jgi:hypothetical protein
MLHGLIALFLLLAALLTLIAGIVLVSLYRATVRRNMQTGVAQSRAVEAPPPRTAPVRDVAAALRAAGTAYARVAGVYTAAGLIHAGISALLLFSIGGLEFRPIRAATLFWALAWPVLLTLVLLWGPDRKRQGVTVLAYFAVLAVLCVWVGIFTQTPSMRMNWPVEYTLPAFAQPLQYWAISTAPSIFLLLFLNRQVRNVGPLILLFMSIAVSGAIIVALLQFSGQMALALLVHVQISFAALVPSLGPRATAMLALYGLQFLGAVLFAVPAWLVVRSIVDRYLARRISDQAIMLDSIWLLMTLFLCEGLVGSEGMIGWLGLAAFAGYKLTVAPGLRPLRRAAAGRQPPRLLLLRTFGTRRRSEQLFDLLATRWRYAGTIELIAGPDLASTALDLHDFLDFVSGRLSESFIHDADDLARRVAAMDARPDPDGRFRVDSFFCAAHTWQQTVTRLIGGIDVVLMDLRGFAARHAGCRFELGVLMQLAPLDRVVLLIDHTTDQPLLQQILQGGAGAPSARSPVARPHLLRADAGAAAAVHEFLDICQGIAERGAALTAAAPARAACT